MASRETDPASLLYVNDLPLTVGKLIRGTVMTIQRSYLAPLALAAAALTAVAGCGGATTGAGLAPASPAPQTPGTGQAVPSDQDRIWMKKIHQGNMAETGAGGMAERKGTAAAVKELGAMLIKDHTALDTKVTQAATRLGVELPTSPSAEQQKARKTLEDSSREDFDQAFLSAMRKEHRTAIAETQTEIKRGRSPEVKALAESALPALQRHLDEIKKAMGGN